MLELYSGGTYIHTYRPNGGNEIRDGGNWKFYEENGTPRVTFGGFLPSLGNHIRGNWDVEVGRSWRGELRFCIDSDLNYYYIRQK